MNWFFFKEFLKKVFEYTFLNIEYQSKHDTKQEQQLFLYKKSRSFNELQKIQVRQRMLLIIVILHNA
jgi:hypothetical protein